MSMNHPLKLFLTVSIIIYLTLGCIFPNSVQAIDIDTNDGIWTDSFENKSTTTCLPNGTSKCVWDNGTIHLTKSLTGGREYDFAGENKHAAYYYASALPIQWRLLSFIYSPTRHIKAEHAFDEDFMYPNIQHFNESQNRYAESSSVGYKRYAVQHFRMKLEGTPAAIGNLGIYWYGKADGASKISMYYWKTTPIAFFSQWTVIDEDETTGNIVLFYNMSTDELKTAIDSDNYIDICIIAHNPAGQSTLFTDYIKLRSTQQEGYKIGYGLVQSIPTISLGTKHYWDLLTWDDYQSGSATIKYQLLYNKSGVYVPIPNSALPGNEGGFTTPPVSLASLGSSYTNIKIQANLSTKDPSVSPKVYSWAVTWQDQNRWQDLFNSEYRIDEKNKIHVGSGAVNISLAIGDWPMFGQNAENTRASSGRAAYVRNLYWWSDYNELRFETLSNPIIDSDSLYFAAINQDNQGSLYKFNSTVVSSGNIGKSFTGTKRDFAQITNGKPIVGSPVVYEQYVIVATGEEKSQNYVYAFDKDAPEEIATWRFDFNNVSTLHPEICYWGSPVAADGLLYLTGWSGYDTISGYHTNNMLLVLDILNDGILRWNYTFPVSSTYLSPTWSFSTPAVSNGKVVVGCMNDRGSNLFALDAQNGDLLWNVSVGAIGKAAPVIYKDTVYIVSEQKEKDGFRKTKVSAVDFNDGTVLWSVALGRTLFAVSLDLTSCLAQATPAIVDDVLYITSPDGLVSALDLKRNGTELWSQSKYSKGLSGPILTSSPAYADHILYIGTPDGYLYALDTEANGSELWNRQTFPAQPIVPVVTDPIVTNGIVFFGGENGRLYVCGAYVKPDEQISGSITSVPISLPEGYWWKKFYAGVATSSDSKINKITFSLLDEQNNFIKTLTNNTDVSLQNITLNRTLRLHADFWAKNVSVNPRLLFWNITFYADTISPFINLNTLTPNPTGWLNEVLPKFTVNAIDNNTGLLVSSARYTIEYILQNQTNFFTSKALCSGTNGTLQTQLITVDLSTLSFYPNITALRSLRINISDLAGNTASKKVTFYQDVKKPFSHINTANMKQKYTSATIRINASASDNGTLNVDASGIKKVELYYRYSGVNNFTGDWIYFANSTKTAPIWLFNFTNKPNQPGGYFELCTIAYDNANNIEDFPAVGDVSFLYDWKEPELPSYSGDTLWFKERPQFSVIFEDDYRLDTIQYRPNFDTVWTTLASHVNASVYNTDAAGNTWILSETYWDQMEEDAVNYLYFRINDTLGNTLEILDNDHAISIRKDTAPPLVTIDIPSVDEEMTMAGNFTVSGLGNDHEGSGIKEALLYYRYSEDNSNWTSWKPYGDTLDSSPFEWNFDATEGDGYYEMKIMVTDYAGNEIESEIFPVAIASFPMTLTFVLIGLVTVLLLLSVVIYLAWRKKETD